MNHVVERLIENDDESECETGCRPGEVCGKVEGPACGSDAERDRDERFGAVVTHLVEEDARR